MNYFKIIVINEFILYYLLKTRVIFFSIKSKILSEILNVDQTGCNYEYHSLRTLSDKGEKCTVLSVKALFNCTHSYTVMPVLYKSGDIFPKIFICFQESAGKLSKRVLDKIVLHDNIAITCSKSGKLTKTHIAYW